MGFIPLGTTEERKGFIPLQQGRGFIPLQEERPKDTFFSGMKKAAVQGATAFPKAFWGAGKLLREVGEKVPQITPFAAISQLIPEGVNQQYENVKAIEERNQPNLEGFPRHLANAVRTGTQMASNFVGTAGLGTLPAMATGAGIEKAIETQKEGYDLPTSLKAGATSGLTEYVTEWTPFKILTKPGLSYLKRIAGGLVADVPGELVATLIEMKGVDEAQLGKKYTLPQYAQAMLDTAATSGLTTGIVTSATHPYLPKAAIQQKASPEMILERGEKPSPLPDITYKQPVEVEKVLPEKTIPKLKLGVIEVLSDVQKQAASPGLLIRKGFIPLSETQQEIKRKQGTSPEPTGGMAQKELMQELYVPNIFENIKQKVGNSILINQSLFDHFDKSEIRPLIKQRPGFFSKTKGVSFDEVADSLGITTDELADKIRNSLSSKEIEEKNLREITDYFDTFKDETGAVGNLRKAQFENIKRNLIAGTYDENIPKSALIEFGKQSNITINPTTPKDQAWHKITSHFANRRGYDLLQGKTPPTIEEQLSIIKEGQQPYEEKIQGTERTNIPQGQVGKAGEELPAVEGGVKGLTYKDYYKPTARRPVWVVFKKGGEEVGRIRTNANEAEIKNPSKSEMLQYYIGQMGKVRADNIEIEEVPFPYKSDINLESGGFQTGYEAIKDKLIPQVKNGIEKLEPVKKSFMEFWHPLSTIPESAKYQYERYRSMGQVAKIENLVNKIWERTRHWTDETKNQVFQFLDGTLPITELPDYTKRYAQNLRGLNRRIGKALVERGLISQEAWEEHKNQYIRYSYLKHILGEDYKTYVGGRIDTAALKARKDLPREYQRAIGLIEDVSIAEPISVSKAMQNVAAYDRLAKIAENPNWVWPGSVVEIDGKKWGIKKLEEEVENIRRVTVAAPENQEAKAYHEKLTNALQQTQQQAGRFTKEYRQLPDTWTYGNLKGMVVRKEIYNDIVPVVFSLQIKGNISKTLNALLSIEREGMNLFKLSKAALNPPTAARNIVSNMVQLNLSGMPLPEVFEYTGKALSTIKDKNPTYYKAVRNGIFKTNFIEGEINEIHNEIREMAGTSWINIVAKAKKLGKYYGKIDDVFKLAKFMEQLDNGESEQTATLEAQKWGMDYSLAHPSVKYVRRHIIPFASYQYKIMPLLAESMIKRPWVIGKYLLVPPIVTAIAMESMDMSDDDWEKLKRQMPMAVKKYGVMLMPWKSKEGNYAWVNLEPFVPFQNVMSASRNIKRGNYFGLASDVGVTNPYADVYSMIKSSVYGKPPRDPYSGKEIYSQLDEPKQKAFKTLTWIYNKWMPTMLTEYGTAGKLKNIGQKDKYGKEITPTETIGSAFGVNLISPSPKQAQLEKRGKIKELRTSLYKKMIDPTISGEEKRQSQKKYQQEIKKVLQGQY